MSKHKGRRPLGRSRRTLGYTIKIDRKETEWYSPVFGWGQSSGGGEWCGGRSCEF